jgi:hypothetical protein
MKSFDTIQLKHMLGIKKIAIFVITNIILNQNMFSQKQLIPNPGFEPTKLKASIYSSEATDFEKYMLGWTRIKSKNISNVNINYYYKNSPILFAANDHGRHGKSFLSIELLGVETSDTSIRHRGFVYAKLLSPIHKGDSLKITYDIAMIDATNHILPGLELFFCNKVSQIKGFTMGIETPQIKGTKNIDSLSFQTIEHTYIADNTYKYVVLGRGTIDPFESYKKRKSPDENLNYINRNRWRSYYGIDNFRIVKF